MKKDDLLNSYEYGRETTRLVIVGVVSGLIVLLGAVLIASSFSAVDAQGNPNGLLLGTGAFLALAAIGPLIAFIRLANLKKTVMAEAEIYTVTFLRPVERYWGGRYGGPEKVAFMAKFERHGKQMEVLTSAIPADDEFDHSVVEIAYIPSLERVWIVKKVKDLNDKKDEEEDEYRLD